LVGAELRRLEAVPERLLSSPARRALDTARLVGEALGMDLQDIAVDERLYLDGVSGIEAAIGAALTREPGLQRLAFFSHEPAISAFCARYGGIRHATHFPTGAACGIAFDDEVWAAFRGNKETAVSGSGHRPGAGRAHFLVLPRSLESR
jgi:phosphohistidine phosphatase